MREEDSGDRIILVGTGPMGAAYAHALRQLERPFEVWARDRDRATSFAREHGGAAGDTLRSTNKDGSCGRSVIIATAPESLEGVCREVLAGCPRRILLEKPGALRSQGLRDLANEAARQGASVQIAANRRFFPSTVRLRELLAERRVRTVNLDFTERPAAVVASGRNPTVLQRWAVANSVHVFDLLSFLMGPLSVQGARVLDPDGLEWHPVGATFSGFGACGTTPVVWNTSWRVPGGFGLTFGTDTGTLSLRPLEELHEYGPGGPRVWVDQPSKMDGKLGVLPMVRDFLGGGTSLPDGFQFAETLATIERIVGYPE